MFVSYYLLFCIVLLLILGAVIAFSYFVIKPVQTRWAVKQARKIVASGRRPGDWRFRNIYRMLSTAHDDLEAAKLWRQLDGMLEVSKSNRDTEFMKLVGIVPPGGKF
jgi:hypothetical protein